MDSTRGARLLSASNDRQCGGHEGYDDDPSSYYSWDERVPNAKSVAVWDGVALWDIDALLAISAIEAIEEGVGEKTLRRCPSCGQSSIKARKELLPAFRCHNQECRAAFDQPGVSTQTVTTYRAHHEPRWIALDGLLSGDELRPLAVSPRSQHAIRPLHWDRLLAAALRKEPALGAALDGLVPAGAAQPLPGGHSEAVVRVRRDQGGFRRRLLQLQGESCAFSGSTPAEALDPAHLYSYAKEGRHVTSGGLLLRRDLHRLFDLGLITVDTEQGSLHLQPELHVYPQYAHLHEAPLPDTILDQLGPAAAVAAGAPPPVPPLRRRTGLP